MVGKWQENGRKTDGKLKSQTEIEWHQGTARLGKLISSSFNSQPQ